MPYKDKSKRLERQRERRAAMKSDASSYDSIPTHITPVYEDDVVSDLTYHSTTLSSPSSQLSMYRELCAEFEQKLEKIKNEHKSQIEKLEYKLEKQFEKFESYKDEQQRRMDDLRNTIIQLSITTNNAPVAPQPIIIQTPAAAPARSRSPAKAKSVAVEENTETESLVKEQQQEQQQLLQTTTATATKTKKSHIEYLNKIKENTITLNEFFDRFVDVKVEHYRTKNIKEAIADIIKKAKKECDEEACYFPILCTDKKRHKFYLRLNPDELKENEKYCDDADGWIECDDKNFDRLDIFISKIKGRIYRISSRLNDEMNKFEPPQYLTDANGENAYRNPDYGLHMDRLSADIPYYQAWTKPISDKLLAEYANTILTEFMI